MTVYRLDGFSFNRDNLRGIDADALAGLNKFLNARERELNTVETESFLCAGGPFDGQPIEVETLSGAQLRTAVLSVGKWTGFYEVVQGGEHKGHAAVWRGTDAPAADALIPFYGPLRAPAKGAKRAELGRGFVQLGELLASMGQDHAGDTAGPASARACDTIVRAPGAHRQRLGPMARRHNPFR